MSGLSSRPDCSGPAITRPVRQFHYSLEVPIFSPRGESRGPQVEAPKLQSGSELFTRWKPPSFSRGSGAFRRRGNAPAQKMGFSPGPTLAFYTTHLYYLLMYFSPQTVRTFFVTSATDSHRAVLQSERMATLLMNCLFDNRQKERLLLHEFVIMPDHFHALITPAAEVPLEKAMQFIKGGFSYRARKELNVNTAIWQAGFTDHRIRDLQDFEHHRSYIHQNPVKAGLVDAPELFPYSSAFPGIATDPAPPWLKPATTQSFSRGA